MKGTTRVGQPVRFDNGHAYVNGVVTQDLGNGWVEVATSTLYTGVPSLTYVYPYVDVATSWVEVLKEGC